MSDFHLLKKYFLPYRTRLAIITLLSIICGLFEAVSLGALVPLINIIATNEEPTGNLWNILKTITDALHIPLTFTSLLIIISIIFLFGQVLVFIKQTVQFNLRYSFVRDIKERIFERLFAADLAYHNNKKMGNFLDTILIETERAGGGLFVITDIFSNICLIVVYVVMLVYISIEMTIFCVIIVLISLFFINRLLKQSKKFGDLVVVSNTEINEYTTERLSLFKLIKANSTEKTEGALFFKIAEKLRIISTAFGINGAKIDVFFQSMMYIIAVTIVFISVTVFNLSFGMMAVFLFVLIRMSLPLRNLNNERHDLAGLMAGLTNVDRTLTEIESASTIRNGSKPFVGITDRISLDAVNFAYIPEKAVLSGISLQIKKNEFVALAGPSGGGKSTLVDLLMRLIDPSSGTISIDGENLRNFDIRSYHAKIGIVSQDVFIFHDTVLANICYGSDTLSPERAREAAKIAYADEFIEQLPGGYNSILGDRGVKLSGGQKQRIALARAICKNPDILILDEATSALDSESEKIIQDSINAIKHKYTIIVVAHRLSTIENADTIYVVEKGKITECGTHDELLTRKGAYAKYHSMQAGKDAASIAEDNE